MALHQCLYGANQDNQNETSISIFGLCVAIWTSDLSDKAHEGYKHNRDIEFPGKSSNNTRE